MLEFSRLGFYTKAIAQGQPYEHFKVRVKVDSSDKVVYPRDWRPVNTLATGPTVKITDGTETTGGATLAVGTKAGVTGSVTASRMVSGAREITKNLSRIRVHPEDTFVEWTYDVEDAYQRQGGLEIVDQERLPLLKFWCMEGEPRDKLLRIELSGYWVNRDVPKKGWKWANFFRKGQRPVPMLRNFCHSTRITIPANLKSSMVSTLKLKACMPLCRGESVVLEPEVHRQMPACAVGVELEGQVDLKEWMDPASVSK